MWIKYNPNPAGRQVGDCSVRAVSKALDINWEKSYLLTAKEGYDMRDMPSSDAVWGAVLREHGFYRHTVPDICPNCYTTSDFCRDHPNGIFVLGFGGHAATVVDGNLYDSWDSSREIPQYFWRGIIDMAYPYYQPYNNYLAYQQPVNAFQNGNSSQSQLQTQMVVRVPSFEAVKTFYAEPGKTVTFFDDNAPYCYVKSGGASPVDPPKIRIFELIERTGTETSKNGDLSDGIQGNIDISLYAKKSEIEPFLCEIERISKEVEKLKEKDGANHE